MDKAGPEFHSPDESPDETHDSDEAMFDSPEVPEEELSPVSRVRIHLHIKRTLHTEIMEIAQAEDMSMVSAVRLMLRAAVRQYKVKGGF